MNVYVKSVGITTEAEGFEGLWWRVKKQPHLD